MNTQCHNYCQKQFTVECWHVCSRSEVCTHEMVSPLKLGTLHCSLKMHGDRQIPPLFMQGLHGSKRPIDFTNSSPPPAQHTHTHTYTHTHTHTHTHTLTHSHTHTHTQMVSGNLIV